jgi:hypothetical protein
MSNEKVTSNGEKSGGQSKELGTMSLEEKLALLSEIDKAYVCGFIDRALQKRKEKGEERKVKREKRGDGQ